MDRREFIGKCGAGLAGIIAGGKAPAAIVKSMLGMGGIKQEGAIEMPTASDYIQDGLVAMWDGIENAGEGVHDDYSNIWKDLVGNNDLSIGNNATWDKNGLTGQAGISSFPLYKEIMDNSNQATIEIVAQAMQYSSNRDPLLFKVGLVSSSSYDGNAWYAADNNPYRWLRFRESLNVPALTFFSPVGTIFNVSIPLGSYHRLFVNGQNRMNIAIGSGQIRGTAFYIGSTHQRILAFRLYAKVLSVEEILHNYAIDKARFGL